MTSDIPASHLTTRRPGISLARQEKRMEILEAAKGACDRLGGHAMIDDRYHVVDATKYEIKERL